MRKALRGSRAAGGWPAGRGESIDRGAGWPGLARQGSVRPARWASRWPAVGQPAAPVDGHKHLHPCGHLPAVPGREQRKGTRTRSHARFACGPAVAAARAPPHRPARTMGWRGRRGGGVAGWRGDSLRGEAARWDDARRPIRRAWSGGRSTARRSRRPFFRFAAARQRQPASGLIEASRPATGTGQFPLPGSARTARIRRRMHKKGLNLDTRVILIM